MAKKAAIIRALHSGSVVILQETHWTESAAAQWGGLFTAAQVVYAPSRLGPRGGPQVGVAVIAPHPHGYSAALAPGCAVEVVLALDGGRKAHGSRSTFPRAGGGGALGVALWGSHLGPAV